MEESLIGGAEAQSLSGAVMEPPGGMIPFLPGDRSGHGASGSTRRPSMGIFIRAPFPGAIGVGPVDGGAQGLGDPFVFAPSVPLSSVSVCTRSRNGQRTRSAVCGGR